MSTELKTVAQVEAETQDEIDEIMNEIENLQASSPDEAEPSNDGMEDFRGSGDDASMEETLGHMKDESTGGGLLDAAVVSDESDETDQVMDEIEEEVSMSDSKREQTGPIGHEQGAEGTLSMTLTGNMVLKLKYEFGGQDVTIGFSEGALRVSLADGTEFKIPVGTQGRKLKAA
jgi:hypothetical protein